MNLSGENYFDYVHPETMMLILLYGMLNQRLTTPMEMGKYPTIATAMTLSSSPLKKQIAKLVALMCPISMIIWSTV